MDMSFSGILSHVESLAKKMEADDEVYKCNLCYSLQGLCLQCYKNTKVLFSNEIRFVILNGLNANSI